MDVNWEQEGVFKNRPRTTLTFERQVDLVFHCLGEWNYEQVDVTILSPFLESGASFEYYDYM